MHSDDVFGEKTEGIDAHVAACESYQAAGDWTAVISNAEGGVSVVTVAKWKDGAFTEEYIMGVK